MRKKKENKVWNTRNVVSLLFVFIMVTSVLAMWKGSDNPTETYNEHKFTLEGNYIVTKINGDKAKFHYFPDVVDDIEFNLEIKEKLDNAAVITVIFDPDDELVSTMEVLRMELGTEDFPLLLNKITIVAVTNESEAYPTLTVTNCSTATPQSPAIYMKSGDNASITMEGDCIILTGNSHNDLLAIKDRMMYGLLNIIN